MVKIGRDSKDEEGALIKPNAAWFTRAEKATKVANLEKQNHNARKDIYGHNEVKKALEKLFNDKCAYCETRSTPGFDWEVEHYRPKGEVAKRPNHPGYYWLTYEWNNLLPACTHCNQPRIDKPRWKENTGSSGGKSTQFPLKVESNRAMSHLHSITREEPLLLDPCNDYPENHLRYDPTGQVHPIKKSKKGWKTIDICHLKRSRLKKDRERELIKIVSLLKFRNKLRKSGKTQAATELNALIRVTFLKDGCIYLGMARYIYEFPHYFGI